MDGSSGNRPVDGSGDRPEESDKHPDAAQPGSPEPSVAAPTRSFGANVASLATSQLVTWALTLLWTVVVPRILGPRDIGLMVIATSLSTLVLLALSVVTREFLVREMVSDRDGAGQLLSTALLTRAAVIPLAFLAAFVYGRIANLDDHAMVVMYLTTAATGFIVLKDAVLAVFQSFERMQYIAYTDIWHKGVNTLGGVLLAIMGFGIVAISSLGALVAAMALGVALWWTRRFVGLGVRPGPIHSLLGRARPYWMVSVFSMAYIWVDGILLGVLVPAEVVGWYGAATRLFTTLSFVAMIIATTSLPRMIAAHNQSSERLFIVSRQPYEWAVIAALPLGVGLAFIADDLVPLIYGSDFTSSVLPLAILAMGLPLFYGSIITNQIFIASGRPKIIMRLLAIVTVFNIGFNFALIPVTQEHLGNGAIGAAASLVLSEILQVSMSLAILGRGLLTRSTLIRLGKAALAVAGMAAVLAMSGATPLAIQVVLGAVTFVALFLLLRIPTARESDMARAGLLRLRIRSRRDRMDDGTA